MIMKSKVFSIITLCLLVTTPSTGVFALALADLELKSSLNQQLDVRIRLLTTAADELENLEVKVTPLPSGPGNLGVLHLQNELIQDDTGNYIKVTTKEAVREPVIGLLVEVIWPGGRYLREYSLLIDPVRTTINLGN